MREACSSLLCAVNWTALDNFLKRHGPEKLLDTEVLTLAEVAAYLKVNEKTIYRMVQGGKIPAFKVAGSWRFKKGELQAWIESNKNTATSHEERPREEHT